MPVTDAYEEPALSNTDDDMEPDSTPSPEDTQELPTPDEGGGVGDDLTPAVKTSYDVAQALTDMCDKIAEGMKKSEHKDAKQKAAKFIAELKDLAEEWKAFGDETKADLEAGDEVPSDGEGDAGIDDAEESDVMDGDDASVVDDAEDEETEAEIAPIQKDATGALVIKGYKPVRWLASDLEKSTTVKGKKTGVASDKQGDTSDLARRVKSLERANKEYLETIKERDKELANTLKEFKNFAADVEASKRVNKRR
jgi:hypothetical protein